MANYLKPESDFLNQTNFYTIFTTFSFTSQSYFEIVLF